MRYIMILASFAALLYACGFALAQETAAPATEPLADSPLFHWQPAAEGFVLEPGPAGAWDEHIRERMWVLYEDGQFKAWYAGWQGEYDLDRENLVHLGYATSPDGIHWTKHPGNPIFTKRWVEDICVLKVDDVYYMYVEDESKGDTVVHLLTSTDGLDWKEEGNVLEKEAGSTWESDWVGTALVWKEGALGLMLYEGGEPGDTALATSFDGKKWLRSDRNPVLTEGVGWDSELTAPDSVVKRDGLYYLFYHARGDAWRSGIAVSKDLHNWTRYPGNPIAECPSPVVVEADGKTLLYITHEEKDGKNGILVFAPGTTSGATVLPRLNEKG
ncbi:MAG: hypothetical protein IT364_22915 [Candidatus Hydrogenedentes bacterium]|nr:hypothetical protein [Candidatus Hydrogenedentota bacterium]